MQGVLNVKIKDEIMKRFIFTAISAGISVLPLFADPIDVPSEYDAATETWVGNPRLRDGLVDVGAYQCWLNPDATTIILR